MSPQITAHSRRSGNVFPLCLGTALRLLGILPSPSTLTRKRTTSRSECAFCLSTLCGVRFLVRPRVKAQAGYSVRLPMQALRPRLSSWYCSLLYRGRLCRALHPWMWARSSRACGLCRAPHRAACRADLVLLAADWLLRSRCGVSCCVGLNFRRICLACQGTYA